MERTFLMVKPDGVQRRLVGEIIRRLENKGFTLARLQMLTPSREMAEAHYGVHRGKPFFEGVVGFIRRRERSGATTPIPSSRT